MSFIGLILKNPFRNKSRAILAIVGIGIGIATIVALGSITAGLTSGMEDTLHAGGADFSVTGKTDYASSSPFGTRSIDENWTSIIQNISGVNKVEGVYIGYAPVSNSSYFTIIGMSPDGIDFSEAKITKGKIFSENKKEVVLGKMSAENLKKTVGDTIDINGKDYKISGVFESGDPNQDQGAYTSLKNAQEIMDEPGKLTMIYVKADKGVDVESLTKKIDDKYKNNITTVSSIADLDMISDSVDLVNSASLAISILAIVIGGIGIINTMIMSVYDRTREIGVLRAVGWGRKRILGMILGESIVLTLTAGIAGSLIGILGVEIFASMGILAGMVPAYNIEIFANAFLVAIVVGLIGGLYPAWRASRLQPTEALRYE